MQHGTSLPAPQGLYDPDFEHDACGLGFVADLNRTPARHVIDKGLEVLCRLRHRGAAGSDPHSGDGCGMLLQLPHIFYQRVLDSYGRTLPDPGDYGVAMVFLTRDADRRAHHVNMLESAVRHFGQDVLGWRDVPVDARVVGPTAQQSQPVIRQLFIGRRCPAHAFERVLFMIRKRAGKLANIGGNDFYVASCSSRTVVYKGLMLPERLADFYPDLQESDLHTTLALVHSRFSTNTFPTWERAHPYRRIAHNGEINTLRGNQNWMHAREANLNKAVFGKHLDDFKRIIRPGGSDSASLDNVVDFLLAGGRSLPHVMMMLIPEAWSTQVDMPPELRAFYEFHGALVEPWDGPAAIMFTDGQWVGAILDRNGLRPAKYVVTSTGLVVASSEFGVLDLPAETIIEKGRLQPGKMLLVDTLEGKLVRDDEIKHQVASRQPYGEWLARNKIDLAAIPEVTPVYSLTHHDRDRQHLAAGYTREEIEMLLLPMARTGEEPVGSMGNDTALAVLSDRPQVLFRYFKQQFAQVTNPPIDPIRESLVMSLVSCVGGEGNLLDEAPEQCRLVELPQPILTNADLAKLKRNPFDDFESITLPMHFDVSVLPATSSADMPRYVEDSLRNALTALCEQAEHAVDVGYNIVVLSDRGVDGQHAAIPSVLAVSAVHHHLIRAGKRVRAGLIVESAEPKEVADMALLIGYGAGAVNPYLAFETIHALAHEDRLGAECDVVRACKNYVKALNKGLLKIMSKMGISTLSSYHGAQIFEILGIHPEVVDRYFTGTPSRIGGIGLREIAMETMLRHAAAFPSDAPAPHEVSDAVGSQLESGGVYAWRLQGERHLWTPASVAALQKAVRLEDHDAYAAYARAINDQSQGPVTLRGLWDFKAAGAAIPLADVEPAAHIVRRFVTGAMSFGSISQEAHENLAIAMNRMGGKSNSGEGGEDSVRFLPDANGDLRRSAVKQVASARFGVTTHYLVNADELQIKIAQGAKPGEGGQLPGHKVDEVIARVRHATPGVTLISPPPHHDIYSIEDLAQLIFDLKNVNPTARVGVKLVSEAGIGTIAAGVAKAHADCIYIAGHDGGTGASPVSSIYHAGTPWELGLAETQQVLVLNGLRSRVRVQVDGQLKTGRDVAFAALLGAEEFGFATAPLVASGCVMMRKCHLNTCPVGVATQDPILRQRFVGQPEHVINYFFFVAEELRQIMASLGFTSVDEMIGRADCIAVRRNIAHPKARLLDFSSVLFMPATTSEADGLHFKESEQPRAMHEALAHVLDRDFIQKAQPALVQQTPVHITSLITNADRVCGAMLAGEIARRYGAAGLPDDTIRIDLTGTAGQSFGAFATQGMTLRLVGDANDYVGKGLSGGVIAVRAPHNIGYPPHTQVIVGNTVLYGATSGKAFFAGRGGERFAVRNSGAYAVVEGVGDHGCEYMTGGCVVVLGPTGRNFAAGMSGGVAYVWCGGLETSSTAGEAFATFRTRCNLDMVALEDMQVEDLRHVGHLIEEHVERTGSAHAAHLLAHWDVTSSQFIKVMPTEYKKALDNANVGSNMIYSNRHHSTLHTTAMTRQEASHG